MKKKISLFLAFLLIFSLSACRKADSSKWQSNDVFSSVPVYKYADVSSADFGTSMNVKIEKTTYDDFVKYIEELKKSGFEYMKVGTIPENYSLNSGTAQWRCTDGKVYLQLIFSSDETESKKMFGCNLQIYGYSDKSFLSLGESKTEKENSKSADAASKQTTAEKNA